MPPRRTRNDWRAAHEIHRAVVGIVSRGGDVDTIAREVHACYVRRSWKTPPVAPLAIPRCQAPDDPHRGTALENGRCPICGWRPPPSYFRPPSIEETATREVHRAIVGIVSRGGNLDTIAYEIQTAYTRRGWKAPGPAGLLVSRCRTHQCTALENARCPTCGWSPLT